ncbi:MAG TPA: DNA mismatch repair protein MutS [Longimicrobiaceae bacterium]|nr:DNA mismatch repair protein MutS [Longimicrobiaceae bacterium]
MSGASTPLMKQWQEAKRKHPDAVVMIRVGDFYELLGPDAEVAVRVLGLTLTGKGGPGAVPMAGVPAKSRDEYLERLAGEGFRVAVCEQVEDPAEAKGTVRREVVEVVTPGVVFADGLLQERRNNFLAALVEDRHGELALAAADVTTGEVIVTSATAETLESELARVEPAELLVPAEWGERELPGLDGRRLTRRPQVMFDPRFAWDEVCFRYGVQSPEGFGIGEKDEALLSALGALLAYLREVQPTAVVNLRPPRLERPGEAMVLDEMTRRNLELTEPLRREPGMKPGEGTLLATVDETLTPMGARLLRSWLLRPMVSLDRIRARQDSVAELVDDGELRGRVRRELANVRDLERLAAKVASGRIGPRELRVLADSLSRLPALRRLEESAGTGPLRKLLRTLDPLDDVRERIHRTLADAPAAGFGDGEGVIRPGFDAELDELRGLREGGTDWMARLQARERERSGISALKVGYNRVFGYFLEVPRAHADRVPGEYERKQTLANLERFVTGELKEWEGRILGAEERIAELEARLFGELRQALATQVKRFQDAAVRVATLDVLAGLAECAVRRGYTRPEVHDGYRLELRAGRHPVVETMMPRDRYIPNDVVLDDAGRVMILTGPNMAGKSTLLRMVGLVQLLAQVGAFVPADHATVGVCDRIFTRVGASDNLVRGQSTFMVEASECATILNGGTRRSLVLMDEVGRGTATWDGVSLAWAITEHLHGVMEAKTIFATHYHELTELADLLDGVVNFNVAAREEDDRIVFLHRLVPGGADRSYGIEVARMAGIPPAVIARAREILRTLEGSRSAESRVIEHLAEEVYRADHAPRPAEPAAPPPAADGPECRVAERIRALDPNRLTPMDALALLAELRGELG